MLEFMEEFCLLVASFEGIIIYCREVWANADAWAELRGLV